MSGFDLDSFLPYQLVVVAARISRDFAELYQQKHDISVAEWRVLAHLSRSGHVSVREIHQRVDMDKSKVSRAVTRLEAAKHVFKRTHPTDRRLLELELTESGRAIVADIAPLAQEFEAQLAQVLGDRADAFRADLSRLMTKD